MTSAQADIGTKLAQTSAIALFGFLALTLVFDFFDKIEIFYSIDFPKFNRGLKAAFVLYAIVFCSWQYKYIIVRLKYWLLTVLGILLVSLAKYPYWHSYFDEWSRYAFMFAFFPVCHYLFHNTNPQRLKHIFYILLKYFVVLNALAIAIGIIFDIQAFQTYQYGRFGYNGFLLSQGMTPYIYMASIVVFWSRNDVVMLILVLLASLCSGIKGVYFGEFGLVLLLLFFDNKVSKQMRKKLVILTITLFVLALATVFMTPTFREVLREDGIWAMIFSYRIENLIEAVGYITPQNYNIFVGALGLHIVRVEMQLFDILLFFGIFGLVVLTYFLFNLYKDLITSRNALAYFIVSLALSLLSGNLFYIPLSVAVFITVLFYLHEDLQPKGQKA